MPNREHWETVYETKATDAVSWYQPSAARSLGLVQRVAPAHDARIIDVGGGASVLAGELLATGYSDLTVLDIAQPALDAMRTRLGATSSAINFIVGDVCEAPFNIGAYDVWHDRAVFHFLADATDRADYVRQLKRALTPGGHVIIAAFAEDGPERCSGLPVVRYSCDAVLRELGGDFNMVGTERELHRTPGGSEQSFVYCVFRWLPVTVVAD